MSAPAHIARENGKKGGRPKGYVAIQAELARQKIVKRLDREMPKIISMLMEKVNKGDLKALEILLERGYGKALQPVSGLDGEDLNINLSIVESQLTRIAGRIRNGSTPKSA